MKHSLSQTNSEIICQASDHLKVKHQMEEELEKTKEVALRMQTCLVEIDGLVVEAENEAERLRVMMTQVDSSKEDPPVTSFRKLSSDVLGPLSKK